MNEVALVGVVPPPVESLMGALGAALRDIIHSLSSIRWL
jgi:hypothetical protein